MTYNQILKGEVEDGEYIEIKQLDYYSQINDASNPLVPLGKDEKAIKTRVQFSLLFRLLFMFVVALVAYLLPKYFDIIPLLISFFFPRLVIMCRGFIKLPGDSKEKSLQNGDDNELPETDPGETDDK